MSESIANAIEILNGLPTLSRAWSFYDGPDVASPANRARWVDAAEQLLAMIPGQAEREAVTLGMWASDAFAGAGRFEEAISALPPISNGARASFQTSKRLCLRLEIGDDVTARDILTLFGPKVTKFGRDNLDAVAIHIAVQLDQRRSNGAARLVEQWAVDAHEIEGGYVLFSGFNGTRIVKPPRGISFDRSPSAEAFCTAAIRAAENAWREEQNIPHVGEGWISETRLYYEIKAALPTLDVIHQARPDWLGRQHLDIFVPAVKAAIEYQGEQHDRPVEFFGGTEAHALTTERDQRKAALCAANGVRLIYVREGYDLAAVLAEIAP
jgi:hypothetical protein